MMNDPEEIVIAITLACAVLIILNKIPIEWYLWIGIIAAIGWWLS